MVEENSGEDISATCMVPFAAKLAPVWGPQEMPLEEEQRRQSCHFDHPGTSRSLSGVHQKNKAQSSANEVTAS